ncbi:Succinylglutamate desuccinylase/aspartoacylase [Phytophthora cactorum]|nr:Succinylglutamate desuccinylase/aspartoacylase [Phytophthora cactorum]
MLNTFWRLHDGVYRFSRAGAGDGPNVTLVLDVLRLALLGAAPLSTANNLFPRITRGSVTLVYGNPRAQRIGKRGSEPHADLNRCFPRNLLEIPESKLDSSYEHHRAKKLAPLFASSDLLVDLHSTNKPSPPFVRLSGYDKVPSQLMEISGRLPTKMLLLDPKHLIGDGNVALTDEFVGVMEAWAFATRILHYDMEAIEFVDADGQIRSSENVMVNEVVDVVDVSVRDAYEIAQVFKLTSSGFRWADGVGEENFQRIPAGKPIGFVGSEPFTVNYDSHLCSPRFQLSGKWMPEGERRVLQLDRPEATDADTDTDSIKQDPSASAPASRPEPQRPRTTSTESSSIPPTEKDPRDVVLHSDGCAIALHLSVVQTRCPWLYKQLRQLRHLSETKNGAISLKVMENEEVRALQDQPDDASNVHFVIIKLYVWTTYAVPFTSVAVDRLEETRRKRLRQDPAAGTDENQPPSGQCVIQKSRRARSLFSEVDVLQKRGVMHVKIEGTNIAAVVTSIEYIYRFKVRVIEESNAMEAVKLGQWLGMRHTMLYYCLVIAIRHVTTATWMEMLLAASTLPDKVMRRILCDRLLDFVKALEPEQYCDVLKDMRCVYISRLKHHDILVRAVVGLINSIKLVEFWRNLLDALSATPAFTLRNAPHFAPEWKPYMEVEPVEIEVKPGEGNLFTLLQFGKFQLQVRIDITDEMPILWRVIRSSSPQLLTTDPDDYAAFDDDPQFWIRGQMKVKYWRAQSNHAEVFHEIVLEYQHCPKLYSQWCDLVPASPSSLAPVVSTAAFQPEITGKSQFRGKFFIWGDPVCSMYHFLLHTTLFYSAPHGSSTELSDLMVVSEMQRLPLETLVLVLSSDHLRIPEGERTLLRCLNKLVFGKNFSYLGSSPNQAHHKYNGLAKDVIRLYKSVRWCFVPLDDIIGTLRLAPRELKFYELIEKGLQDTFHHFLCRRPWGWRKYRHAYMKNETNAGENELSPEYFPCVFKSEPNSQDSLILNPDPVYSEPPRSLSVPY